METRIPSLGIHSPSICWHQAHLNQVIVQPYNYELFVHIDVFSNIPLSLELNPSSIFPLKTLCHHEAVRAPLAQIGLVINHPNLDKTLLELGFDSNSQYSRVPFLTKEAFSILPLLGLKQW